jgi:hypothetical protein
MQSARELGGQRQDRQAVVKTLVRNRFATIPRVSLKAQLLAWLPLLRNNCGWSVDPANRLLPRSPASKGRLLGVSGIRFAVFSRSRATRSDYDKEIGKLERFGTIYRLVTWLSPFVEALPAFGAVGTTARILGTNLAGTTKVTSNGTQTGFAVGSESSIIVKVPVGATNGSIQVTTAGAELASQTR